MSWWTGDQTSNDSRDNIYTGVSMANVKIKMQTSGNKMVKAELDKVVESKQQQGQKRVNVKKNGSKH